MNDAPCNTPVNSVSESDINIQELGPDKPSVLEASLSLAISSDQLQIHYQPIVKLLTGKIIGVEALLRWEHPALGCLSPRWFMPMAEKSGFITEIGEWMLRKACQDLRAWLASGTPNIRVAVNLSAKQFWDPLLVTKIRSALSETLIDPGMLSIEVSESTLIQNIASSKSILQQLKGLGLDLTLDDFGTGIFPFHYLEDFPFNRISIDQSLIQHGASNGDDAVVSKNIISLIHARGIQVGAKRVETESQRELMSLQQCDEFQGYVFSRALPSEDILALLHQNDSTIKPVSNAKKSQRTLLLVDDESNILGSLKRLLRRENYQILTANGGREGLELLKQHEVDVIVSDQRMPGMTGVEFFREAKILYPHTVRIVLSGYTELQSVTDAINEGAVYKFITKPWDDDQLRGHIDEAFRHKEVIDENDRLNVEIRAANQKLAIANYRLENALKVKQQQIARDEASLDIVREALQHIPLPVIGLDDTEMTVFVNIAAKNLFHYINLNLGDDAKLVIPELVELTTNTDYREGGKCIANIENTPYEITMRKMGGASLSRGWLLALTKCDVKI